MTRIVNNLINMNTYRLFFESMLNSEVPRFLYTYTIYKD